MQQVEQVRQARKLFAFLDTGTTAMAEDVYRNPVSDYTCQEQAAREREVLFGRMPLCLGLSCRAPAPGSYFEEDLSGVPILVVRGRDGVLRAFLNVCRHRGSRVVEGCGRAHAFRCPYHAWTYGLDGRLLPRPHEDAFAGAPTAEHGLRALPCVERDGIIWVSTDPEGSLALDAHLGELGAELAAYGYAGYHHYETRLRRQKMNWKLVMDTFMETYHLDSLHPATVGPILFTDRAAFDAFGPHHRLIAPRRTIGEMRARPEAEWDLVRHSAIVYSVFPNTILIMQGDHLESWHVYPAGNGVDEAAMVISLYTPEPAETESARQHWDRNFDLLMATVEAEDFPVGERIQQGFYAGAQPHITFGRNEPALQHYHRSVRAAVAA